MIQETIVPFLVDLSKNNNKEWFQKNKLRYQQAHNDFKDFIDHIIPILAKTDPLIQGLSAKDCVYRIYRDVRFSKDKTPYKTHFGANIAPGGRKSKKAGFYVHIDPSGESITGGGLYMPEPPMLKALRNEFLQVPEELIEILEDKKFKKYFSGLWGDKLKLAPKGFPKDFEHIELLKHKSFVAIHEISNNTLQNYNLVDYLTNVHKALYPLNRLINTILEDAGY